MAIGNACTTHSASEDRPIVRSAEDRASLRAIAWLPSHADYDSDERAANEVVAPCDRRYVRQLESAHQEPAGPHQL